MYTRQGDSCTKGIAKPIGQNTLHLERIIIAQICHFSVSPSCFLRPEKTRLIFFPIPIDNLGVEDLGDSAAGRKGAGGEPPSLLELDLQIPRTGVVSANPSQRQHIANHSISSTVVRYYCIAELPCSGLTAQSHNVLVCAGNQSILCINDPSPCSSGHKHLFVDLPL